MVNSVLSESPVYFPDDVGLTVDPIKLPVFIIEAHILNPTNHELNISVDLRLWMTSKFVNTNFTFEPVIFYEIQ